MSQVFINKITGHAKTQERVICVEEDAVAAGAQTSAVAATHFEAAILFK